MDKSHHIPQEQFEEIERYFQSEMTQEEQEVFMTRMSNDTELKQRVNEMQLLFIGVQEATLQQRLKCFHEELPGNTADGRKPVGKLFSLKTLLAVASVVAVVAVSAWWLFFKPEENQSIFADYFSPDPGLISAMSTSNNYLFDRAMIDYKTGNYKAAIRTWDSLQVSRPNNDTLNYFLGSAFLAAEQADKSISYLERVTISQASVFLKDAYWYLALAWLKEGDTKKAIHLLELSDHPKKDALLTRLKK